MKYVYYGSHAYMNGANLTLGNFASTRSTKIESVNDLEEIANSLRDQNGWDHAPTILQFQLLREEEDDG